MKTKRQLILSLLTFAFVFATSPNSRGNEETDRALGLGSNDFECEVNNLNCHFDRFNEAFSGGTVKPGHLEKLARNLTTALESQDRPIPLSQYTPNGPKYESPQEGPQIYMAMMEGIKKVANRYEVLAAIDEVFNDYDSEHSKDEVSANSYSTYRNNSITPYIIAIQQNDVKFLKDLLENQRFGEIEESFDKGNLFTAVAEGAKFSGSLSPEILTILNSNETMKKQSQLAADKGEYRDDLDRLVQLGLERPAEKLSFCTLDKLFVGDPQPSDDEDLTFAREKIRTTLFQLKRAHDTGSDPSNSKMKVTQKREEVTPFFLEDTVNALDYKKCRVRFKVMVKAELDSNENLKHSGRKIIEKSSLVYINHGQERTSTLSFADLRTLRGGDDINAETPPLKSNVSLRTIPEDTGSLPGCDGDSEPPVTKETIRGFAELLKRIGLFKPINPEATQ